MSDTKKMAVGTRVVTKSDEHGVVVEPGDWRLYDDECVVELDGGHGRWVFSADDLTVIPTIGTRVRDRLGGTGVVVEPPKHMGPLRAYQVAVKLDSDGLVWVYDASRLTVLR